MSPRVDGPKCPDTAGGLVLTFNGESSSSVTPPSGQATSAKSTFKGTVTAVFDDNAEVATVNVNVDIEASRTEASGRSTFVNFQQATKGSFTGERSSTGNGSIKRSSQSFSVLNSGDVGLVRETADIAVNAALGVLAGRKVPIQNNGWFIFEASPKTKVGASEVAPFEVRTKHVVERIALDKRVDVTLTGKGAIDPTSLSKTPDKLTYTAGAERDDTGALSLVSKSRRGMGIDQADDFGRRILSGRPGTRCPRNQR